MNSYYYQVTLLKENDPNYPQTLEYTIEAFDEQAAAEMLEYNVERDLELYHEEHDVIDWERKLIDVS